MSTTRRPLVILGAGQVGRALVNRLLQSQALHEKRDGLLLPVVAWCELNAAVMNPAGIASDLLASLAGSTAPATWFDTHPAATPLPGDLVDWIDDLGSGPCLIADVTASGGTAKTLIRALEHGHRVATANKIPLTSGQEQFDTLAGSRYYRHESTVGSAVPVIDATRALLRANDRVDSIQGVFSGTLGFLCSEIQTGRPFSDCLQQAMALGYTEPDPRVDLGGMDVARKALILARMLGWRLELADMEVVPMLPKAFSSLPLSEFLERAHEMDADLATRAAAAERQGQVLRYVADIRDGKIHVGLTGVSVDTAIGRLRGSDNLVAFRTRVYADEPLVLQGRGAGADAAAAGVHSDLVALALGE